MRGMGTIITAFLLIAASCVLITVVITVMERGAARRAEQERNLAAFRAENAARYSRLGVRPPRNGSVNGPVRTVDERVVAEGIAAVNAASGFRFGLSWTPRALADYFVRCFKFGEVEKRVADGEVFRVLGIGVFKSGMVAVNDEITTVHFSLTAETNMDYVAGMAINCSTLAKKSLDRHLDMAVSFYEHCRVPLLNDAMFEGDRFIHPTGLHSGEERGWFLRESLLRDALAPLDGAFSHEAADAALLNVVKLLREAADDFYDRMLDAGFDPAWT